MHNRPMKQRFARWKERVSGGESDRAIARRMGIDNTKVGRHLNDSTPPVAETVIEFARAYDASPVDGLIAAELITAEEAKRTLIANALRDATTAQLLAELTRRAEITGQLQESRLDETSSTISAITSPEGSTQRARTAPSTTQAEAKTQRRQRLTEGLQE